MCCNAKQNFRPSRHGFFKETEDYKMNKYHDAIVVGGCGMDMAFSVVHHLQEEMKHNSYFRKYSSIYSLSRIY